MPANGTTPPHRGPDPAAQPELRHRQPPKQQQQHHQHHQTPSTPITATPTLETLETKLTQTIQHLLPWDALPPWRRDNPSILHGYRPTSHSFLLSLRSLGYLHNESVNIWTHLLGAAAAAAACAAGVGGYAYAYHHDLGLARLLGPRYATASAADAVAWACFLGGAVCCLGMSATYHLLCNHSEEVARWGNKLDYTGIVFLIVGSFVPALWYGFFCRAALLTGYLGAIALLGVGCLVVSWFEHFRTPAWRPYRALMFVGLGLSGVVPVLHGLKLYGYRQLDERMGLSWVLLEGGLYIFGAFLYGVRFPECKYPGAFDIWGSSHQIFHVCVLLAAASHVFGMIKAFDHHHSVLGSQC